MQTENENGSSTSPSPYEAPQPLVQNQVENAKQKRRCPRGTRWSVKKKRCVLREEWMADRKTRKKKNSVVIPTDDSVEEKKEEEKEMEPAKDDSVEEEKEEPAKDDSVEEEKKEEKEEPAKDDSVEEEKEEEKEEPAKDDSVEEEKEEEKEEPAKDDSVEEEKEEDVKEEEKEKEPAKDDSVEEEKEEDVKEKEKEPAKDDSVEKEETVKIKKKRCPNGTRKNKKGECVPVNKTRKTQPEQEQPQPQPQEQPQEQPTTDSPSILQKILPASVANLFTSNASETKEQKKEIDEKTKENVETSQDNIVEEAKDNELMDIEPDVQNENDKLFKEELQSYNTMKKKPDFNADLYPDVNDPNFNIKIAQKQEFKDHQYNGTIANDIREKADEACESEFEILPHQHFVRNFMSSETPYNSLLLFHELGTGKTCSAIGIAEEMRSFMKQTGIKRKIMVIASPNVQDNFRLQLFDPAKLVFFKNKWTLNTCIGNALLREINPQDTEGMSKEDITRRIRFLIKKYYIFTGYESVESGIMKENAVTIETMVKEHSPELMDLKPIHERDSPTVIEQKQKAIAKIQQLFDNRLIIVDEIQNILARTDNIDDDAKGKTKRSAKILKQIATFCNNTRFILLSATPVYNQPDEIVSLVNLMNVNDNRAQVRLHQILDKNGEFQPEEVNQDGQVVVESGRDLLKRKLIGYVSYVRGENPYTFPFRLYPKDFDPDGDHLLPSIKYPTRLLNGVSINKEPAKHILNNLYITTIGEHQKLVYDAIVQESVEKYNLKEKNKFQFNILYGLNYVLNMTYPVEDSGEDNSKIHHGTLKKCMKYEVDRKDNYRIYDFEYQPWVLEKYGRIFDVNATLSQYSSKIHSICQAVQRSNGMVLIYSRYLEGGLLPMALALEEMGLSRHCTVEKNGNLMKKSSTNPIKPFYVKSSDSDKPFLGKYAMITGTTRFSPNNKRDLEMVFNKNNYDGKYVKVVLISEAGSEGIDFKFLRQIHIMDPWYNISRAEQIIGRGVRNKSHCMLPFEQRNVEIYMHASVNPAERDMFGSSLETADLYMYRLSEEKAIKIGQITRVMKEVAVDCLLNNDQQNFNENKMNTEVMMKTSSGKEIQYRIGDKSFSSKCDYMEKCEYQCSPSLGKNVDVKSLPTNTITYGLPHLQRRREIITKRIRQLFREKAFYKRDDLIREIQLGKPYKLQEIYYILGVFLKTQEWVSYQNTIGYLVRNGNLYTFQPQKMSDVNASMYERTNPYDYKPERVTLQVNVKKNEEVHAIELISQKKLRKIRKMKTSEKQFRTDSKNETIASLSNELTEKSNTLVQPGKVRNFDEIYSYINDILTSVKKNENTGKKENTMDEYGKAVMILWCGDLKLRKTDLYYYIVVHLLDTMAFVEKVVCVKHFFQKADDFLLPTVKTYTTVKEVMYSYFQSRIVRKDDLVGIVLLNKNENELYSWNESSGWNQSSSLEINKLEDSVHKKLWLIKGLQTKAIDDIENDRKMSIVGYMHYDSKGTSTMYDFKIRDMFITRIGDRSGVFCKFKVVSNYLDPLLKQLGYDISYRRTDKNVHMFNVDLVHVSKGAERTVYCLLFEFLLRHLTNQKPEQVQFLSPEEGRYCQVQNLAIDRKSKYWLDKSVQVLKTKFSKN